MPTPTLTWRPSAVYAVSATTLAACLQALKDAVDAEVAANPSTAIWQVADFSSVNGTLVLKRRTGAGGGNRRIMLFGGAIPSGAATGGATGGVTTLYGGVAPTAGVDAPQQAFTAGAPFTTGVWVPGGIISTTYTSAERVSYWESADGIVVVWRRATTTAAGNTFVFAAGGIMSDVSDDTVIDCSFGSAGTLAAAAYGILSSANLLVPAGATPAASNARCQILYPGDLAASSAYRIHGMGTGDSTRLKNGQQAYFLPMFMGRGGFNQLAGKLRQMAFGPAGILGQVLSTASGVIAYGVGDRLDADVDVLWLTNFKV